MRLKKEFLHTLKKYKQVIIILTVPFLAAILPLSIGTKESRCAYVVILMAVFWLTEALPVGVTSLFPVVFFPILDIMPSDKVTVGYFKDIVMLFFGGLVVANAIEMSKLHERIALKVLLYFGSDPKWLLLGFMLITAFLSLWISNTASTAMMLPVIDAVVKQLLKLDKTYQNKEHTIKICRQSNSDDFDVDVINVDEVINAKEEFTSKPAMSEGARRLYCGFSLACAYSATIGGLGSLVGTGANVLVKGYFDKNYPEVKLNFLTYFMYAFPVSVIMILISWIWLTFRWLPKEYSFFSKKKEAKNDAPISLHDILVKKYFELGSMNWEQKCVSVIFVTLITLWVTRDLHVIPGWGSLFKSNYTTDATSAIIAVILLFCCPKENIFAGKPYSHLVDWSGLVKVFPWGIFLLIGGGLVMASGFKESGLSEWSGRQMKNISGGNKQFSLIFIIVFSATATEFTSNVSIASIFIPIVDALARESNINPIFLILPLILSVSLAFMLPIASPNNAMIFASGNLKIKDMVSTGVLMNLIGFVVIYIASNTWLGLIFDLNSTKLLMKNVTADTNLSH